MRYISTRGGCKPVTASQAIIQGLSNDGGLFVPESIDFSLGKPLAELVTLPYIDLAREILRPFLDFSEEELALCVKQAYAPERFDNPLIAPLVTPFGDNVHFLELFHGPTMAFKDMALSILPHLMLTAEKSMPAKSDNKQTIILTATSGDTGKAALEAFCNIKGISIVVFYPQDGVSAMQKHQMVTQEGDNTYVFGVEGNFDDAQTGVKKIFSDYSGISTSNGVASDVPNGVKFSSANSINIGRLLPQIVYYFYAYGQLAQKGTVKPGEPVHFVVPTGNFGNILAGYYAKQMGLPISKLVCASNDNKVLYDFFHTGAYDKNRPFYCTISPSMDILVSSNLERLLFHATDAESVRAMMDGLAEGGRFETTAQFTDFYGAYADEHAVQQAIADCAKKGYIIDPHTAVAYHAGQQYIAESGDNTPQVIISTASPYKFAEDVLEALGKTVPDGGFMESVQALYEASGVPIPEGAAQLANKKIRHTKVCRVDEMKSVVESILI